VPWRPLHAGAVVAAYLPFALVWFLLLIGYLRAMHGLGHPVVPQVQLQYVAAGAAATPGFWLVVAGTVVAAPVAEELVFRGYLLGALQLVLPGWAGLVATAAIFGYVHTLPCALPIALLGLFLGWLRQRHGSLWPSILAHGLHNAVVVLVTVLWPASLPWMYPQ
jgi:membrane protease YdiL (CAAX protease family)